MYLLFGYVRYRLTGEFVYGFIENEEFTLAWVIVVAIITYAFVYLLSTVSSFPYGTSRITLS